MSHYVYVLEMLGYGNVQRSKIGIAKDVEKRVKSIGYHYGGLLPDLRFKIEVADKATAFAIERAAKRRFKSDSRFPRTEILAGPVEPIIAFVMARCAQ